MAAPRPAPGAESASASAASTARSRSRAPRTSRAAKARFGRAKPRTICGVSAGRPEARDDLVAHDGRRRRGAGEHARAGQLRQQLAELEVVRPEVVAPFADAVRFVDGDQRAGDPAQQAPKARRAEALGRGVEQPELAALGAREPPPDLTGLEGRRQIGRGHAAGRERLDLVVHQGDQRRDDQGGAGEQHGRELIAEALAASGGRHQQDPAAAEQLLDGLALSRAEGGVAEPAQAGVEIELGFEHR